MAAHSIVIQQDNIRGRTLDGFQTVNRRAALGDDLEVGLQSQLAAKTLADQDVIDQQQQAYALHDGVPKKLGGQLISKVKNEL